MADIELMGCPFCGGAARIEINGGWLDLRAQHENDCLLSGDGPEMLYMDEAGARAKMVSKWNRRSTSSVSEGEIKLPVGPGYPASLSIALTNYRVAPGETVREDFGIVCKEIDSYTEQYARAAIAADRRARQGTVTNYGTPVDNRAATKAAAPADASSEYDPQRRDGGDTYAEIRPMLRALRTAPLGPEYAKAAGELVGYIENRVNKASAEPVPDTGDRAPAEDAREEVQGETPLYDQALDLVNEAQRASVSLVQRRLRIGWSEARDLIQLMHDRSQIPDAWLPPGVYPRAKRLNKE